MSFKQLPEHIQNVCKIGQGAECCKYLLAGQEGFICGKITEGWKAVVDDNWAKNAHVSQGDNCEGKENLKQ